MEIHYELREYDAGSEDLSDFSAEAVAAKIGLPPSQLYKTLVARGDRNGVCMAAIPSDMELDIKALAAASGDRKIHLVPVKELPQLTGYIRGGVTVLAAKKQYPVYVDERIESLDLVSVSAGMRGLQIVLSPADYLRAANATVAMIATARI